MTKVTRKIGFILELVSKELNHFRVIACLFRHIGGHSSRFVLVCSFWRLFTIKMITNVKVFPFSFWKIITFFFTSQKSNPRHKHAKWPTSDLTPWTLTLLQGRTERQRSIFGTGPHIWCLQASNFQSTLDPWRTEKVSTLCPR